MLKVGSSYRNLVRDVIPLLPTLAQAARTPKSHRTARAQDPVTLCAAQVRNESGPLRDLIWCKTTTASHCFEAPNRECLDNGDTCGVLFKDYDSSDGGVVEQMISSSLLPLVIVYSGGGFDFLNAMPEQTFLFCILCSSSNL